MKPTLDIDAYSPRLGFLRPGSPLRRIPSGLTIKITRTLVSRDTTSPRAEREAVFSDVQSLITSHQGPILQLKEMGIDIATAINTLTKYSNVQHDPDSNGERCDVICKGEVIGNIAVEEMSPVTVTPTPNDSLTLKFDRTREAMVQPLGEFTGLPVFDKSAPTLEHLTYVKIDDVIIGIVLQRGNQVYVHIEEIHRGRGYATRALAKVAKLHYATTSKPLLLATSDNPIMAEGFIMTLPHSKNPSVSQGARILYPNPLVEQ